MSQPKRRLAVFAVVASLLGVGAAAPAPVSTSGVAVAKSCDSGYKHGIIDGSHKCLKRGQYCSKGNDRQYHRYDFHCHGGRLT